MTAIIDIAPILNGVAPVLSPISAHDKVVTINPAESLRATAAAVRVSFTWMGTLKTVSDLQKDQMADAVECDGALVKAKKVIINVKSPTWRNLTSLRTRIKDYWQAVSLPYTEPGMRLLRRAKLDEFVAQMNEFKVELDRLVQELSNSYEAIKTEARERLGNLFNPSDYPVTLDGLFNVEWDFPSVEPPSYLMEVRPDLYAAEQARVRGRFEQAVFMAEASFTEELRKLVEHLTERLTDEPGIKKVFRDSAVSNFKDFFQKFKSLNVGSNAELDRIAAQAEKLMNGLDPKELRSTEAVRQEVRDGLAQVQSHLSGLVVNQPRRTIIRRPVAPAGPQEGGSGGHQD